MLSVFLLFFFYKPGCNPNPGPFGSSVNELRPPSGSDAKRPFLGPAAGALLSIKSCKICSVSSPVRSSCNRFKIR